MRIGYGFNRSDNDFVNAGVDRVYIDTSKTDRLERFDMLLNGLRPGDTVVLLAPGDLGRGTDLRAARRRLEELAVAVEIAEAPKPKEIRSRGRPRRFAPSPENDKVIRELWYADGKIMMKHVLARATELCGVSVTRNQLDHYYGPRDGSQPNGRKR